MLFALRIPVGDDYHDSGCCLLSESQSEMSALELELKKVSDQKQDLERKLRMGEDDKASFEKVCVIS